MLSQKVGFGKVKCTQTLPYPYLEGRYVVSNRAPAQGKHVQTPILNTARAHTHSLTHTMKRTYCTLRPSLLVQYIKTDVQQYLSIWKWNQEIILHFVTNLPLSL